MTGRVGMALPSTAETIARQGSRFPSEQSMVSATSDRLYVTPRAKSVARTTFIALVGGLNVWLVLTTIPGLLHPGPYSDFVWLSEAAQRISAGQDPYSGVFRWSPLAAWLLVPLQFIGLTAWRLLHFAILPLLPWRVAVLVAVSYPFWFDVELGNLNVLALVLAWWALRGKPLGFIVLALLIPRPLYVPVLAYVLWKQPAWRGRFLVLGAASLLGAFLTGWGPSWLAALGRSDFDVTNDYNLGPSHLLGLWWVPIGLTLAAFLTWKGKVGLAALAASPYLLPYYYLMGFLELRHLPKKQDFERRDRVRVVLDVPAVRDGLDEALDIIAT